jgi:hypothetical protein
MYSAAVKFENFVGTHGTDRHVSVCGAKKGRANPERSSTPSLAILYPNHPKQPRKHKAFHDFVPRSLITDFAKVIFDR